jgi:glycosyltransferase involved in cell wall biosynthesis
MRHKVAIISTVGLPANYGGFETLAENLAAFHSREGHKSKLVVYCSSPAYAARPAKYLEANLKYVPLRANGAQSILYDLWSICSAVRNGATTLLILGGGSNAIFFPFVRFFTAVRIVTNIDGLEWKRSKWGRLTKWFLQRTEKLSVDFSHVVIADNQGIADYLQEVYGAANCTVVAYGGDHALSKKSSAIEGLKLPEEYAFALCRVEPENNVHLILNAFASQAVRSIVFVGNWKNSQYGQELRKRFFGQQHIILLDPIYDLGKLRYLREKATFYVHGHSVGGTNPSLVEMMYFGVPVFAYDCAFNRHTTFQKANYFLSANDLVQQLESSSTKALAENGTWMRYLAEEHYTWQKVSSTYFQILTSGASRQEYLVSRRSPD